MKNGPSPQSNIVFLMQKYFVDFKTSCFIVFVYIGIYILHPKREGQPINGNLGGEIPNEAQENQLPNVDLQAFDVADNAGEERHDASEDDDSMDQVVPNPE